jgi:hypothetical protein
MRRHHWDVPRGRPAPPGIVQEEEVTTVRGDQNLSVLCSQEELFVVARVALPTPPGRMRLVACLPQKRSDLGG